MDSAVEGVGEVKLALTTRTPWSPAQSNADAESEAKPEPWASSTRSGTTMASGATPAMPLPLLRVATTVPVTCVPWPFSSSGFASSSTQS